MIIKLKKELYHELLQECVDAQKLVHATEEECKDVAVNQLLDRHFVTLCMYFDYLHSLGSIREDGELKYCVDMFEFSSVVSLVGFICPCATALAQRCFAEPDV